MTADPDALAAELASKLTIELSTPVEVPTIDTATRRHVIRYGVLPTAFVVAFAHKAAEAVGNDEADSAAFAQAFLRDHWLDAD